MKPELRHIGKSQSPLVVIDEFSNDLDRILRLADSLAPYPRHTNYYPGVRRVISTADEQADAYVRETCRKAAQFIGGGFGLTRFELLEASFSIVSTPPTELAAAQRAPHFDTTDEGHLALLHYLRVPSRSGTAFYRQRSTGIERLTASNVDLFVSAARSDAEKLEPDSGYIQGSDAFFEQIGSVEAVPDRLIIYQGSLLHSGIIPPAMAFSTDPREGRLTANLFVQGS